MIKGVNDIVKDIEANIKALKNMNEKINRSYKVSAGWTTKYRNALNEANQRLIEAGLEPVKVIGEDREISKIEQRILDEAQQESFF